MGRSRWSLGTAQSDRLLEEQVSSRYHRSVQRTEARVESAAALPPSGEHPIIFFDGVCVLCNGFIDRMLRADRGGIFRFAPLQGETARTLLPPQDDDPLRWSLLYRDEHGVHAQSDAALEICRRLGGAWAMLSLLRLAPRRLRDAVYRLVVRNRYRWFGQRATCRVPSPAERARFLR